MCEPIISVGGIQQRKYYMAAYFICWQPKHLGSVGTEANERCGFSWWRK